MTISEEDLVDLLSGVLLKDDIEGLDEDLVAIADDPSDLDLDESMVPFLDSVGCPADTIEEAKKAIQVKLAESANADKPRIEGARKLQQGVVSMASTLSEQADEEANRYLWGTDDKVKANANTTIEAYKDKTSAKDKRKQRQELEKARRELAAQQKAEEASTKSGVSSMILPTVMSKEKDVNVTNVSLSLDNGTVLLENGDLKFAYKRRYGIVGENGCGKTTLLRQIANWEDLDGFPRHLRVLHVRQELTTEDDSATVLQAVLEADIERQLLLKQEKELSARLEGADPATDDDTTSISLQEKRKRLAEKAENDASFSDDMEKLQEVYERLQLIKADTAQARAAMILTGLQFTPEMQMAPIKSLSGGWRMRVALAAALLIEPDLLMLDEPTNHLDLEAVIWLEQYLVTYPHTVIVVSHDRGFLDAVVTDIIEFRRKQLTYWRGNFSTYVKLRDESIKNTMRVYESYKLKREHLMEFITKFRANAKRATMVQSRIKTVEKMDAEAPEPIELDPVWRFSIPSSGPLGRPIISINDVTFDYNAKEETGAAKLRSDYLLQDINFGVDLSSRIAILGANGQGKTTLLNLIMGTLRPISGDVTINSGLRIGHFTQHHSDNFDLGLSATENMLNIFEDAEDQEMRSFLGRFQIQGVDALKPMGLLSGGQKSRVAFAALAYKKPHVLVIDEGSNHLSMDAVDALVEAVRDFQGGLIVVSHDQYFVSQTCSELWVVDGGKATRFRGSFDDYKKYTADKTMKRVEETVKKISQMNN